MTPPDSVADRQASSFSTILLSNSAGIYWLRFNRPDRLNSFNEQMQGEVARAISVVENDPDARVVVITGEGRGFCTGQDLSERDVNSGTLDLGYSIETYWAPLVKRLARLRVPVVCGVNGIAAGAGVSLAIACDIVIAKASAKFVQAFSSIGLVPDAGGTWFLPRLLGPARAMAFALMGETITAAQAASIGLIWQSVDDDEFDERLCAIADRLGTGPTFGLGQVKRLFRASWDASLDDMLLAERDAQRLCGTSPDYKEGVLAFKEKRAAVFSGKGGDTSG